MAINQQVNNPNEADGNPNSDAQQDECDSMAAIFADDFTLISRDPLSYSIRLRPDFGNATEDIMERLTISDVGGRPSSSLLPPDDLALVVTYPRDYPDTNTPIFGLAYDRNRKIVLHDVQERALLKAATDTALAELGMPSVYSCMHAVQTFLENRGLDQAGVALLSDDCLMHILAYYASSKEEVDQLCTALPIFEGASKTNVVWKQLCQIRWGEKWGFNKRWGRALMKFRDMQQNEHYWTEAYQDEEADVTRNWLSRDELLCMTFDSRQWFSFTRFRNQPANMRDVLPTGLRDSISQDVVFEAQGIVSSQRGLFRMLEWKSNNNEKITQINLKLASSRSPAEQVTVYRTKDWGWELRGSDYVLRALDKGSKEDNLEKIWEDLTKNIIVEERDPWVKARRGPHPYDFREIPDDEDCKLMLDW